MHHVMLLYGICLHEVCMQQQTQKVLIIGMCVCIRGITCYAYVGSGNRSTYGGYTVLLQPHDNVIL